MGFMTKNLRIRLRHRCLDVVDFGLYQIIITDANGCNAFENNILIASPPSDLDISVTPVGPSCAGLGSAEIAIGTSAAPTGPGPSFAVYSPVNPQDNNFTLVEDAIGVKKNYYSNLIPGVIYIVHDSVTGCYYFETAMCHLKFYYNCKSINT
jgi:hypothetical protein